MLTLMLFPLICRAQMPHEKESKQLLIISAYNEGAPWSRQYISIITREISKRFDFKPVDVAYLNNILIYDEDGYRRMEDGVFENYAQNHPDYVVLVGNFAFCLRERIKKEWGDIPMLLIAQSDKFASTDYYFTDPNASDSVIPPAVRPLEDLRDEYNFTLVQTPNYPRETVDMMMQMYPNMYKVVLLGDALYINRNVSYVLREYMKLKYPNVQYEWFVASDENKMQKYLFNLDPNVGLILSTWYYVKEGFNGMPYMSSGDSYLILGASRPVFGLRYAYFPYGILGCYNSNPEYSGVIDGLKALISGEDMRNVPFVVPKTPTPVIDYRKMVSLGILESKCPPNTVFLEKPKSLWEEYSIYIYSGIAIFVLVILFLVVYIVLIKRRAKLKRAYDNLVETMPIGYQKVEIELNSDGKLTHVGFSSRNKAFLKLIEDQNLRASDRLKSDSYWQEVADSMMASRDPRKTIFRTTADSAYVEFIMYPSEDSTDGMLVVDVFAIDVTDKMKMEQVLRETAQKALEADNMKSAFLANMSHEIRTPINAIVGFAGLLCKTDDPEKKKKFIDIIESNNHMLLKLIEDILDISKAETDKLVLNISTVDVNKLIHTIVAGIDVSSRKDVRIAVDAPLKKCLVTTDSFRLGQVITNLLANSLKFTEKGSITVGYSVEDDRLNFYVKDTGRGISANEMKVIFDRSARLDSFIQGTGLGLTISRAVVAKLGGTLEAVSEGRGKGSKFMFSIPYVLDESKNTRSEEEFEEMYLNLAAKNHRDANEATSGEKTTKLPSYKYERRKVLIVEDNESNFQLYEALFDGRYDIVHAWDGDEAIRLFAKETPDIVLMDIGIPFKNGYEATAEIRMLSKSVPIIAVTSYAEPSDQQKVMQRGFNDYLTKPIDEGVLLKMLRKYL